MRQAVEDGGLVRSAEMPARDSRAAARLAAALGPGPFGLVAVFAPPAADFAALMTGLAAALPGAPLIGCTTAGEIGAGGYVEDTILALALPAAHFAARTIPLPDLAAPIPPRTLAEVVRARSAADPARPHAFAFLVVDGLSRREDALVAALAPALGPVPLFGGSAGDGTRFERTLVAAGAETIPGGAVLAVIRTDCPVRVFSLDHLRPSTRRMVVTDADPARRLVRRINGEPAAREYARLLGKDPGQLSTFTFAAHPVVVRLGGAHHVRAIQRVTPEGELVFFSAIDEGLVLTLAEAEDMVAHLDRSLARLGEGGAPAAIWACDCILRRVEARESQALPALGRVLARHRVRGFSTYGEQINGLHVNQTMTGVAIYPPPGAGA
ncbi:FIST N-terminal domain-containing protein [Wenxinia saemankumensis]|uniref:Uncharacterized conserved protein, contains FIST_N domain n=1 Tax=Wenxinia saemankumensis TaxID=1447782 RepID=A0A1M6AAX6_9RHOB|nr:FIST N-terminal domain-containing protein [Wenxinia saemankumensis]SHI33610.1 Uncharacterized conserved protein, contains FIST_N domain [Wenxinia saemankumensis]